MEILFLAAADIFRGPRFADALARGLRRCFGDAAVALVSDLVSFAAARLSAQYFFIRSPTALRSAADILRRSRFVAGLSDSPEVVALAVPLFPRSCGNVR